MDTHHLTHRRARTRTHVHMYATLTRTHTHQWLTMQRSRARSAKRASAQTTKAAANERQPTSRLVGSVPGSLSVALHLLESRRARKFTKSQKQPDSAARRSAALSI